MDYAARQFARRILLLHAALFALVVAVVFIATNEVYRSARRQAIEQAIGRQELLARQTATGIGNYYASIFDDLELIKQAEGTGDIATTQRAPATRPATMRAPTTGRRPPLLFPPGPSGREPFIPPLLWNQLKGRVSHFLTLERDRGPMRLLRWFPVEEQAAAQQIAAQLASWLRPLDRPAISRVIQVAETPATVVCVPIQQVHRLLLAVVPISSIQTQFLDNVAVKTTLCALVLDHVGQPVAGCGAHGGGDGPLDQRIADTRVAEMAREFGVPGRAGSRVFEDPPRADGSSLGPAIVTAEPIDLPAGKKWSVVIASSLGEVDAVVVGLFRRTLLWGGFVVVSMTAILLSTAVQMIRARVRLERLRTEMLTRELAQARQIQLAWLPSPQTFAGPIEVAAINQPANHISGDFYDWFELPDGRAVITIGDVTGHGMSAAFLMATSQLLLRTTMLRVGDPGRCLQEVNRQLCGQVFNGQFVTVLILVLDPATSSMDVASAGHFPALLGDGNECRPLPIDSQLVLGVDQGVQYMTDRVHLPPGASLLLYTDGVIDVQSPAGERFATERLRLALAGTGDAGPERQLAAVLQAVNDFRVEQELYDDLTLVAARWHIAPAAERAAEAIGAGPAVPGPG